MNIQTPYGYHRPSKDGAGMDCKQEGILVMDPLVGGFHPRSPTFVNMRFNPHDYYTYPIDPGPKHVIVPENDYFVHNSPREYEATLDGVEWYGYDAWRAIDMRTSPKWARLDNPRILAIRVLKPVISEGNLSRETPSTDQLMSTYLLSSEPEWLDPKSCSIKPYEPFWMLWGDQLGKQWMSLSNGQKDPVDFFNRWTGWTSGVSLIGYMKVGGAYNVPPLPDKEKIAFKKALTEYMQNGDLRTQRSFDFKAGWEAHKQSKKN